MGRLSAVASALIMASVLVSRPMVAAAEPSASLRASFAQAQALIAAQRPDDAAQQLDAVVAADPSFADAWFALALARRRAGQCPLAVPAYRRYAELRPNEGEPYYGLGLCLKDMDERPATIEAMEKYLALEHRPSAQKWTDNARSVINSLRGEARPTGMVYRSLPVSPPAGAVPPPPGAGSATGAPPVATAVVTPPVASPAAGVYADAQALRDSGRVEAAITRFQQAVAADPTLMPARAALGELLLKIRRDDQAVAVFQAAVRQNSTYPLAWYELGFALREVGRLPEAVDAYQAYIKLRPTDPDPYYGLGRTLQRLGRSAEARAAFQSYLSLEKRPSEERWIRQAQAALAELGR
jgi:tetratricopeptide (TPR) repeat protein